MMEFESEEICCPWESVCSVLRAGELISANTNRTEESKCAGVQGVSVSSGSRCCLQETLRWSPQREKASITPNIILSKVRHKPFKSVELVPQVLLPAWRDVWAQGRRGSGQQMLVSSLQSVSWCEQWLSVSTKGPAKHRASHNPASVSTAHSLRLNRSSWLPVTFKWTWWHRRRRLELSTGPWPTGSLSVFDELVFSVWTIMWNQLLLLHKVLTDHSM